jgi:hypothetical protein
MSNVRKMRSDMMRRGKPHRNGKRPWRAITCQGSELPPHKPRTNNYSCAPHKTVLVYHDLPSANIGAYCSSRSEPSCAGKFQGPYQYQWPAPRDHAQTRYQLIKLSHEREGNEAFTISKLEHYTQLATYRAHWNIQSHSFFNLPNPILGLYSSTLSAPKSNTE